MINNTTECGTGTSPRQKRVFPVYIAITSESKLKHKLDVDDVDISGRRKDVSGKIFPPLNVKEPNRKFILKTRGCQRSARTQQYESWGEHKLVTHVLIANRFERRGHPSGDYKGEVMDSKEVELYEQASGKLVTSVIEKRVFRALYSGFV